MFGACIITEMRATLKCQPVINPDIYWGIYPPPPTIFSPPPQQLLSGLKFLVTMTCEGTRNMQADMCKKYQRSELWRVRPPV